MHISYASTPWYFVFPLLSYRLMLLVRLRLHIPEKSYCRSFTGIYWMKVSRNVWTESSSCTSVPSSVVCLVVFCARAPMCAFVDLSLFACLLRSVISWGYLEHAVYLASLFISCVCVALILFSFYNCRVCIRSSSHCYGLTDWSQVAARNSIRTQHSQHHCAHAFTDQLLRH